MKRYIFVAILGLIAATGLQAQVLVKHGEVKETIDLNADKVVKITFDVYDQASGGDIVTFVRQSGEVLTFDIDEIYALGFAPEFTEVEAVEASGKTAILYDVANATIHIVNAEDEEAAIYVFNAEGRLVKSGKGCVLSVADLVDGLYIVSYNKELNAKIMKK